VGVCTILPNFRTSPSQPAASGTVSVSLRRTNSHPDCHAVTTSATEAPLEIAAVALPLPIEKTYSYSVPPALRDIVRIGSAVLVPFGHQSLTGIVTMEGKSLPDGKGALKSITDVLDIKPVISGDQLKLAEWIADYYLCAVGEVLRAALPPGIGSSSEQRISRTYRSEGSLQISAAEKKILSAIPESGAVSVKSILRQELTPAPAAAQPILPMLDQTGDPSDGSAEPNDAAAGGDGND